MKHTTGPFFPLGQRKKNGKKKRTLKAGGVNPRTNKIPQRKQKVLGWGGVTIMVGWGKGGIVPPPPPP